MDDQVIREKVLELMKGATTANDNGESILESISNEMFSATLDLARDARKKKPELSFEDSMHYATCHAVSKSTAFTLIQSRIQLRLLNIAFDSFEGAKWADAMKVISELKLEDLDLHQ